MDQVINISYFNFFLVYFLFFCFVFLTFLSFLGNFIIFFLDMSQSLDDLSAAAIYEILFNDVEEEEAMEVTNEFLDFDLGFDVDISTDFELGTDFVGFTAEDVQLSRDKAFNFNFLCNDWMQDFNVDTLWTGRNYKNLQFALQSHNSYIDDHTIVYDFKLSPKYIADEPLGYTVLEHANQKGSNLLFDTKGYQYNKKPHIFKDGHEHWRCSMSQSSKCKAHILISQQKQVEFVGLHLHEPKETVESLLLIKDLKYEALKDPYSTAPQILNRLLAQKGITEDRYHSLVGIGLPTHRALLQKIHRVRRLSLPPKELNLFFEIDYQYLTMDFLQKDLIVGNQRFILLCTREQLEYLLDASTWFVDGTFAIAKKTAFAQLLVIHVIVGTPFSSKSIPVMYVFMSRRQCPDYIAVFTAILQLILDKKSLAPYVTTIMMDFEAALWSALRQMITDGIFIPNLKLSGCTFHFCQALFRKLALFKLAPSYNSDPDTKVLLRQHMALPLLPVNMILGQFLRLRKICYEEKGTIGLYLTQFSDYFFSTWIKGNWKPSDWCQFRKLNRTNNVSETNNSSLKRNVFYGDMSFYSVVTKLYSSAQNLGLDAVFSYNPRNTKKKVLEEESFLLFLWSQLKTEELKPVVFLQCAAHLKMLDANEQYALEESRTGFI